MAMRRRFVVSRMVPGEGRGGGGFALVAEATQAVGGVRATRSMLRRRGGPAGGCQKVNARGQGRRARTWFLISCAGRDQSIAPCSFLRRGAFEARDLSCTMGWAVPDSSSSMTRRTSFGAHRGEAGFELFGVFVGVDRRALLGEAGAGVEAGRHLDDAVAGFGFAVEDGPLDRGGAAILGQQRAVQVDAAEAGGGERFGAEDFAVVADDEQVGGERCDAGLGVGGVDGVGGPDCRGRAIRPPAEAGSPWRCGLWGGG